MPGNDAPKIAHVCLDLVPSSGGSVVSVRDFSRATEHALISFTQPEKLAAEGGALPGTVHVQTSPGLLGRAFAWAPPAGREAALASVQDADLIASHLLLRFHAHWVQNVARRRRIPYWVIPHGALDDYVFSYRSLAKKVWLRLFGVAHLRNAACVIFATEAERLKARKYYGGENCQVIRWPVRPLDTSGRTEARAAVRRRLGIGAGDRIVLFLGRLHPMKRPLETVAAFARAGLAGTHLVLVGPEETVGRESCRAAARERGATVHLPGAVYGKEKEEFLLAADLYVSLSHRENFGYTAAEALAAGVPLLLSPGNALAHDLAGTGCGWMLQDDTPEAAVAALQEFGETTGDLLEEMGRRGREWALEHLGFERFAAEVRELAARTLQQGRAGKGSGGTR